MERNFSNHAKTVLAYSREEAGRLQNTDILPEHLLLGIIRDGSGRAIDAMLSLGLNPQILRRAIENELSSDNEYVASQEVTISKSTDRVLKMSMLESRLLKSKETDTEHILLAMLRDKGTTVARILNNNNVTYDDVLAYLKEGSDTASTSIPRPIPPRMGAGFEDDDEDDDVHTPGNRSNGQTTTTQNSGSETPVLDNFGSDMTLAAEEGRLDPVVGREMEIERLAQILSRRKKNNPILIGEPGVGKSAIVEGLALRIVQRKVSRVLFGKRVISLDVASIVAGTKYRGQFEERMKAILNELSKNPNIILFIDEIHTIVGAGGATGTLDAANMLKPALARGELQCIGATTLDEYRKNIEKDGALERRFQKIMVEPTSPEETLQILKNIKDRYEDHHNVRYTDEALEACVKLTGRYISDRNFPDKAIDALDEAGSRVHISNIIVPKEIEALEQQIEEAGEAKMRAVSNQNYELAASYRDKSRELQVQLETAKQKWESKISQHREIVNEEQIAEVVAMMSGIPVQRVAEGETRRLLDMNDNIKSVVIGQDNAVDTVVKAIQRNRIGLKDPNKPIGTFLFLGPTGVGKTHLAKKLAEQLFDSKDALIRIDMSEYMEKFSVSRLVGAPPGYVGYEEGGQLTERVRRKPYSVVLLDEIEKAHPDTFNLLLQVMDEGRLTDSLGRQVDFKNTVIILTSNIGTRQLKDFGHGVGYATKSVDDKVKSREVIHKALNKAFSPEFLNRVDDIVMFDQLDKESIFKIIEIELSAFYRRVEQLGYKLIVSNEAKEFLAEKGYDVQYGARPLKRAIQKYLEDELAEMIIRATISSGDTIIIEYDSNEDKLISKITNNKASEE
ncbi:MAG: ATP-dependent Clp protease ATP-binding subunit [Bacteroidales bacterium]|nr:ATP-dependent Clp protease ATP-binding subunit [Bacteroidales bacterium]